MKSLFAHNNQEKNSESEATYLAQCYRRAIKYHIAGNTDAAKKFFGLAAINNEKIIHEAAYNLAIIYKIENNMEKAIQYFKLSYEKDALKSKSAHQIAYIYEKKGLFIESYLWSRRIDFSELATKEKAPTQKTETPQLPSKENKKRILPPVPIFKP